MNLRHPQLKQFVVQNIVGHVMTIEAFNAGHAKLSAELNGHVVTKVMAKDDFDRQMDAFKMGRYAGFQEGYKAAMCLPQHEEEAITELVTQISTIHKARWDGRL